MGMGGPAQPHLGLSSHPHHVGPGTPGKLRSGLLVPAWSQLCLAVIRLCLMCYQHWDCPWLVDQLLSLTSDLLITTNLPEFLPQQNLASISGPVHSAHRGTVVEQPLSCQPCYLTHLLASWCLGTSCPLSVPWQKVAFPAKHGVSAPLSKSHSSPADPVIFPVKPHHNLSFPMISDILKLTRPRQLILLLWHRLTR